MARYLAQRFALLIGIVFIISVLCFLLVHLIPGNPALAICGTSCTPSSIHAIDSQLGLLHPLPLQYWTWISNAVHGNLGKTSQGVSVVKEIKSSYKTDLWLVVYSQIISFLIAIPLSVYAARRPGGKLDQSSTSVTFAFYSLPAFILAIWAAQFFCVTFHLFPGPGSTVFPPGVPWYEAFWTNLHVMFLPSLVLAIGTTAVYYRLLRSEMVFTLQEEFITVARSKGLSNNRILWRHALRPSTITLLTSTGNNIALLITGLFIIEVKFGLPGIGQALVSAVPDNDYLLVQGIALVTAVTVVVVNFAVDIITTFVDPRIARA